MTAEMAVIEKWTFKLVSDYGGRGSAVLVPFCLVTVRIPNLQLLVNPLEFD